MVVLSAGIICSFGCAKERTLVGPAEAFRAPHPAGWINPGMAGGIISEWWGVGVGIRRQLLTWVIRSTDIATHVRAAAVPLGAVLSVSRGH